MHVYFKLLTADLQKIFRYAVLIAVPDNYICVFLYLVNTVPYSYADICGFKHFDIVQVISEGYDPVGSDKLFSFIIPAALVADELNTSRKYISE